MIDIGQRIKQLRIKNGLTLQELASRTELTKGFLSQLERNLTSPSLQTLEDIAEALGTNMSGFFEEEKDGRFVFTPEDAFVDEREDQTVTWVIPNAQKNAMEPVILKLNPGAVSMKIEPHEGEEFGYVLNGRVALVSEKSPKAQTVRKGDSFYVSGDHAHWLENRSNKIAEVLWVSTPPEF